MYLVGGGGTCPGATLSTTIPMLTGIGLEPWTTGHKPVTNPLLENGPCPPPPVSLPRPAPFQSP